MTQVESSVLGDLGSRMSQVESTIHGSGNRMTQVESSVLGELGGRKSQVESTIWGDKGAKMSHIESSVLGDLGSRMTQVKIFFPFASTHIIMMINIY